MTYPLVDPSAGKGETIGFRGSLTQPGKERVGKLNTRVPGSGIVDGARTARPAARPAAKEKPGPSPEMMDKIRAQIPKTVDEFVSGIIFNSGNTNPKVVK
jgi:hypothetical protein